MSKDSIEQSQSLSQSASLSSSPEPVRSPRWPLTYASANRLPNPPPVQYRHLQQPTAETKIDSSQSSEGTSPARQIDNVSPLDLGRSTTDYEANSQPENSEAKLKSLAESSARLFMAQRIQSPSPMNDDSQFGSQDTLTTLSPCSELSKSTSPAPEAKFGRG